MKSKILLLMLVSLPVPVHADCNIMNLMKPCYTKQYVDTIIKQRTFFSTHKQCSYLRYVKLNEECKPKSKKGKHK